MTTLDNKLTLSSASQHTLRQHERSEKSAEDGDLCVSTPGQRVFFSPFFHLFTRFSTTSTCRGPAHDITTLANEASDVMGCGQRRLTVYLLRNCCSRCPIRTV